MKRLILVRHAKTEPYSNAGSDVERKLKKRGHTDTTLICEDLKKRSIRPDIIVSSPAVRAYQTAEIFADKYGIDPQKIAIAPFVYDGDTTEGMMDGFTKLAGDCQTLMVVGHNPDMAMLCMRLSGQEFFHFPTTATVVLSFSVSQWKDISVGMGRVEYFVYPKMLKDN